MADLEIQISHVIEEKEAIQAQIDQFKPGPGDTSAVLKENLELREQNNKLRLEVIGHRRRVKELNDLMSGLPEANEVTFVN